MIVYYSVAKFYNSFQFNSIQFNLTNLYSYDYTFHCVILCVVCVLNLCVDELCIINKIKIELVFLYWQCFRAVLTRSKIQCYSTHRYSLPAAIKHHKFSYNLFNWVKLHFDPGSMTYLY